MSHTSYAHLLTSAKNAPSAKKAGAKEVDPDESETMEAPPANDREDGKKASRKAKAKAEDEGEEDEDEEEKDSDEGEDEEEREDKKDKKKEGKKAKKAAASGDVVRAAILEERLRCATIFQSKAAAGKPHVAAKFAFHTELDAESAIVIMESLNEDVPASASATPARRSIDERMARVPSANVGSDASASAQNLAIPSDENQIKAMPAGTKALMILNAGRMGRGEEPLKSLPQ